MRCEANLAVADNAAATGKMSGLRVWWDESSNLGPGYGCLANVPKTYLITNAEFKLEVEVVYVC